MASIEDLCDRFGLAAVYLFGSRAEQGLRALAGERVSSDGHDLDVGVVFRSPDFPVLALSRMQAELEDVFTPLSIDLVVLQRVDPLLAYAAVDGHRIADRDGTAVAEFELDVMRRAAEFLPVQRRLERDLYGISTT